MADYFDITWGRIRLWCSSITTDNSRTQVVHELASGDDHPVQDRGRVPRKATCSLLFIEMPTEVLSFRDRFEEFAAQVDRGDVELFTHPINGSYFVHVENFTYDIDEDGNISNAVAVFIAAAEIQDLYPAQLGSAASTGIDSVGARADALSDALADFEIESTVAEDAKASSAAWIDSDTITTRDITVDISETADAIDALITDAGLQDDLLLWPAYQAAVLLNAAYRSAADAATSETPSIFFMLISTPTSVLALVTRVYGGAESTMRERQFRSLNDMRSPGGLIDSGETVAMPARSSRRQAF